MNRNEHSRLVYADMNAFKLFNVLIITGKLCGSLACACGAFETPFFNLIQIESPEATSPVQKQITMGEKWGKSIITLLFDLSEFW
jgi:hypothetical protein